MEKNILNEVTRLQDLMGINSKPLINEKKNTEKRLISEIKLKPALNFPDVKAFDNFRNSSSFKNIGGLLDFNFNNLKGFTTIPQNIDGLTKHLTDFKPIWIASLVDNGDSIENATGAIDSTISKLKKIKTKSLKQNLGDFVPNKNYRFYETIPEEGGLRNAVLHQYKDTYGIKTWEEFKTKLGKSPAELKKLDADVNAVSDAIKNVTVPKVKGGSTPKVKGSAPTPSTSTLSPGGRYTVGTPGHTIESTPKPDGSGYYVWKEVKDEWLGDGGKNKNTLLDDAFKEGWRPGDTIPDKFKSGYASTTKNEVDQILDGSTNLKEKIANVNKSIDPRNPTYAIDDLKQKFGIEGDGTPEQMSKLEKAWDAGYRGDPKFILDDDLIVKDSKLSVENLIKKTKDTDANNKKWTFEDSKKQFGLDDDAPSGDYEKFYNAWNEGWRPKNKNGETIPVEPKYQTELYKRQQEVKTGDFFRNLPTETTKGPGPLTKTWLFIRQYLMYRQISTWEDILRKSADSDIIKTKLMNRLRDGINRLNSKNLSTVNLNVIREEVLKAGFEGDVKTAWAKSTTDIYKSQLIKELETSGLDELRLGKAIEVTNDFFDKLNGAKTIQDLDNLKRVWSLNTGEFNGLTIIDELKKIAESDGGTMKILRGAYGSDVGKGFLNTVLNRSINLIKSGSVFTRAEILAFRAAKNFTKNSAKYDLFWRIVFKKILIPTAYAFMAYWSNTGLIWFEEKTRWNWFKLDQEPMWKQMLKGIFNGFLVTQFFDGQERSAFGYFLNSLTNMTGFQLDDIALRVATAKGREKDTVTDPYKIKYVAAGTNIANIYTFEDKWVYFPRGKFGSYDEVQAKIYALKTDGVKVVCDETDYNDSNLNSEKLSIPNELAKFCKSWKCNEETGNCAEVTDGTGVYKTREECVSKSDCKNSSEEYAKEKKKTEDAEKLKKAKKEYEDSQNKTTVTPGQTVEYLKYVANRDLGISNTAEYTSFTEYGINYNNNPVWGRTIGDMIFLLSIDGNNKLYKKEYPMSKYKDGRTPEEKVSDMSNTSGWELVPEKISESTMKKLIKKIIMESNKDKKFGEENFEHWKKTFRFHTQDAETKEFKEVSKETIEAKQVEIEKMLDHYRKKYDEDDSFVRSVVDVFSKDKNVKNHIKKIGFNKGLAHISETVQVGGLLKVLSVIRESKELEIWSVKYYNDGNWELVKGSFNDEELKNVGKTVTDRNKKDEERRNPVEGLKKKELTAIEILKQDEKQGLSELPSQVKRKTFEKLRNGWVTEKPYDFFDEFYTVSDINTVFNDKIKIYKLNPTKEFFESLLKNSSKIFIRKGFCKSLNIIKNTKISDEKGKKIFDHILNKCQTKFKGEYGITQINKYL